MAPTEALRHRIYQRLEELLGHEEAAGLMEYLPPVGWADVATTGDVAAVKSDIAVLRRDLDALEERFELRLESGLNGIRTEMANGFRSQQQWLLGYVTVLNAALFAALKLTG